MEPKTRLKLEVLFAPRLWLRTGSVDAAYDKWLWDAMEYGAKPEPALLVETLPKSEVSRHYVRMLGKRIWMSNAPYADCSLDGALPTRITALRFRRLVEKMRASNSWYLPDPFETMYGEELQR